MDHLSTFMTDIIPIKPSCEIIFNLFNPFEYIEKFCTINGLDIPIPEINSNLAPTHKYDPNLVLDLMTYDYVIFFTSKYWTWFKKPLIQFFKKCEILCLNYYDKKFIERSIEQLNFFINKMQPGQILELVKSKYKLRKLKKFCFFENSIEPNILYKKIDFANEQLFISFDKYSIKRIEYKLKAFSQIAEKMGADKISIIYDKEISEKNDTNITLSSGPNALQVGVGGSVSNSNETTEQIKLGFDFSNDSYNFNLNKYDLVDTIQRENSFFLSKEEFASDIDLNFLIDARCINLIKEYETELVFKHANEWEKKIFAHAAKFKLNLDTKSSSKNDVNIKIKISFLNIYKHFEGITGFNLYCFKEGFFHLCNLIRLNPSKDSYLKISNFLSSHLYYLNKGRFIIPFEYNKSIDLIKTHDDILKLNFTQDELSCLFEQFFSSNLNYMQFKNFRSIILKQPEKFYDIIERHNHYGVEKKSFFQDLTSPINKLLFVAYQYHIITNYKIKLIDKIKIHTQSIYNKMLKFKSTASSKIQDIGSKYQMLKHITKKFTKEPDKIIYFIQEMFNDYEPSSNPIYTLINPLLHRLVSYVKSRGLIIKVSNEHKLILNLFAKLCACAKKYNILEFESELYNFKYTNLYKYISKYIAYLPDHFLDYETPEDLGNMDIDNTNDSNDSNDDSNDDSSNDGSNDNLSVFDDSIADSEGVNINVEKIYEEISEFSFENGNTNIETIQSTQNIQELILLIYKYVYITGSFLEDLEVYKKNKIVYNPNNSDNVLSNLIKIYKQSLDEYYKKENIEETIFMNVLFYSNDIKYFDLEKVIVNCFNISFNIDYGLYEYVCTSNPKTKFDNNKFNLSKQINNILVNKTYEEQNILNIVAQLLIPLIIYELGPGDFEFDIESKDKTKISLIKKINSFILKILRNSGIENNENIDLEFYRKKTHENYCKHKIFYTMDNLQQMITSLKPTSK
jgi:hypothetical protein